MATRLIFLSNDHGGSLKLTFSILVLILAGISYCFVNLGPTIFQRNGTSVISAQGGHKGGKVFTTLLPQNLSSRQFELLNFAYGVAKSDGYKNPEFLQGLILQESKAGGMEGYRVAGDMSKKENQYFGVGQIKLAAAIDVMKIYPELWRFLNTRTSEELQARLILDDQFNIRVASKYLLMMGINQGSAFAITAYNRGIGGAQVVEDKANFDYTKNVVAYSNSPTIKKVNSKK